MPFMVGPQTAFYMYRRSVREIEEAILIFMGLTYRNNSRHRRSSVADAHVEIGIKQLAAIPTPCVLVEVLHLGQAKHVAGSNLGTVVILLGSIDGTIAIGTLLGPQVGKVTLTAAHMLTFGQFGAKPGLRIRLGEVIAGNSLCMDILSVWS